GPPAARAPRGRIAVIGAGIAGASLARAFSRLGASVTIFAPETGEPTAAPPAAVVSPRLDAGLGAQAALFAQAFARARAAYATVPESIIARGALQLQMGPKDAGRFARIAAAN